MIAPAAVDGRPLSHPDHDRCGPPSSTTGSPPYSTLPISPGSSTRPSTPGPDESFVPAIESVFLWVPPAIAVTDLIVNGTLDRHPELHIGIVELSSVWVPQYLMMLDGGWEFTSALNGGSPAPLEPAPERVLPAPGPGLVLLLRTAGSAGGQVRRPVHVLQRLSPFGGHGHARRGLCPWRWIAGRRGRALRLQHRPPCSAGRHLLSARPSPHLGSTEVRRPFYPALLAAGLAVLATGCGSGSGTPPTSSAHS